MREEEAFEAVVVEACAVFGFETSISYRPVVFIISRLFLSQYHEKSVSTP